MAKTKSAKTATLGASVLQDLSVYVHWPYCARICPYCDFNIYKNRSDTALTPSILKDLSAWRDWSGPRPISSLHFGGGTPSLMPVQDIKSIINHVEALWGFKDDAEIGLEANPLDAEVTLWTDLKRAGINRLSLGIQSFHDPALKLLGRDHDSHKAKDALALTADIFDNFSADLIFGWAGQNTSQLEHDLNTALEYNPPHLSTYQLTIEENTAFGRAKQRGISRAVGSDASADLYEHVTSKFKNLGYDHYEVSNFAKLDVNSTVKSGLRSAHNLGYWRGQDYVGVGPGAHGRLTNEGVRFATINAMTPAAYTSSVTETGFGISEKTALTSEESSDEYLLMGLRISEGVSLQHYKNLGGTLNTNALSALTGDGFLIQDQDRLYASDKGRPVLNHLTDALLI